jgi:D-alanine-D-alanine ligase
MTMRDDERSQRLSRPAVIFGGPSPEHDVSVLTGLQAAQALTQAGHQVEAVYWSKAAAFFAVDPGLEANEFAAGVPKGARELRLVAAPGGGFVAAKGGLLAKERPLEVTGVVNCCHGGPGEDGTLQAALDLAGVPYTGPTVAGAALGMDKWAFAGAVKVAGLPALDRVLLDPQHPGPAPAFAGPYIVKPRFGGSSIGIAVVPDWPTATHLAAAQVHLRRGAVVEPYRQDSYDLNVAVRTFPQLQLSAIERPLRSPGSAEILGYGDKYLGGEGMVSAPRELPARIAEPMEKAIRDAAAMVAVIAGVRGVARIDFLADGDDWFVNEVNTIPGSLAKYLWVDPEPVPFLTLLTDMLAEATERPSFRFDATGADGTALMSAGTIASKLG